jgi:glutathione S-transferase
MRPILPALVTILALILYVGVCYSAGRSRARHRIEAPAVTGHPDFERAYRVQMNTLEQLVVFLPALWLYAMFLSPLGAAIFGLVWVVARVWYAVAYARDPARRGPAFLVAGIASAALLVGGLIGVLGQLARTGLLTTP